MNGESENLPEDRGDSADTTRHAVGSSFRILAPEIGNARLPTAVRDRRTYCKTVGRSRPESAFIERKAM